MLAHRRSVDHIRRRIARSQRQVLSADVTDHSGVDEGVILETEAKVVREAVRALPEAQLDAVLLAYFGGRTYREVAQELGIPEGTAKSRLRAALSSLADRLEAQGILER
jgi:RNA polymerase sigma factor (sigma-70 family)